MDREKVKLFYSYSHKDEAHREVLETHLSILSRNGVITEWHDRRILAGENWENAIDERIREADIILLLVSADFIASEYCYGKELALAIDNQEANKSVVIPVIVRPVDWANTPFSSLQSLPKDALPVTSWRNSDDAWLNVEQGVKLAAEKMRRNKHRVVDGSRMWSIRDLLTREVDRLETTLSSAEEMSCTGLPTGLDDLDHLIDGFHPGQLVIVASRPTMGKTDLALGFAAHVAIAKQRSVGYFSLSRPAGEVSRKIVASLAYVSVHALLRGTLGDDEWPRLTSAVNILTNAPLFIDDNSSTSFEILCARLREAKKAHSLALIVIDSLQLLQLGGGDKDVENPCYIAQKLKALTRELNITLIITTTLPRSIESRVNKRPLLSDLSVQGDLDEAADIVIFVYRDAFYYPEYGEHGLAEIIVAKNSNGPIGTIRTIYMEERSKFANFLPENESEI